MSTNGSDSGAEQLDLLITHKEKILNNQKEIEELLDEQFNKHPTGTTLSEATRAITKRLQLNSDEETAINLASALVIILTTNDSRWLDELAQSDEHLELAKLLTQFVGKFNLQATKVSLEQSQGENFWSDINSDLVLRSENNTAGLNHYVEIAYEETVEISTDVGGNLEIVAYLLWQQHRAMSSFTETAVEQMDPETARQVRELADKIVQQYDEVAEQREQNTE